MTDTTTTPVPMQGNWNEQKEKLKAKFSTLTDSDLSFENGKKDAMIEKVQTKLGKTKDEMTTIITAL